MVNHKKFFLTVLVTFIPIVIIGLTIYIFFIYPEQKYPIMDGSSYDALNEIYRSMNATNFRFGCSMTTLACLMIAAVGVMGFNEYILYVEDPTIVDAKVISKDIRSQSIGSRSGFTQIATYFVVNFELKDKSTLLFLVNATQFSLMFEGNVGRLIYKEYMKRVFIDFIVDG